MAKGVLGNDPFQRGAASRQPEATDARKPAEEKKPAAKKAKASGKPPKQAAAAKATKSRQPPATSAKKASAKAREKAAPPVAPEPIADEAMPLREPAAPVTPRTTPPARPPVMADDAAQRTAENRRVDRALTEALAAEVAEAAAAAAVDEALQGREEANQDVDRVLATELAAGMAEAAVREVLDQDSGTSPHRARELAATVAAQVAGAAGGPAVDEVLEQHASRGPLERGADSRAPLSSDEYEGHLEDEDDEDAWGHDAWGLNADADDEEPLPTSEEVAAMEQELELTASVTRDEFPPQRRSSLSLVPPVEGAQAESFSAGEFGTEPERPPPSRAGGMFALAREIAGQALASEGLGRAMGAMQGLVEAVRTGLGASGGTRVDEYGKDAALVENLQPVLDFLYGPYWRVSVQGAEMVPSGAAILVANHSGALPYDGLVMAQAIARERPDLREPRWLVEDQVFHAPVLGTLFNRLGAVRACPENALRLLDEQRPVVVFPEGYQGLSKPFAERYRLKRFGRGGFVKLALRTGAPIVPVAIVGAEETSPLLGRIPASFLGLPYLPLMPGPLPLPAKWSIRFGEPIDLGDLAPESAEDLGEVQRLTERTRESIQGMIQALLRERRSVFAG
ncbi:acyltransferase [Corallococcus sp. H22C18031201]|nr:acyltransferase [Corallococcus sp. H22C18031201]